MLLPSLSISKNLTTCCCVGTFVILKVLVITMCHFRATHTYLKRSLVASEFCEIPNLSLNLSISIVPYLILENSDVGLSKGCNIT